MEVLAWRFHFVFHLGNGRGLQPYLGRRCAWIRLQRFNDLLLFFFCGLELVLAHKEAYTHVLRFIEQLLVQQYGLIEYIDSVTDEGLLSMVQSVQISLELSNFLQIKVLFVQVAAVIHLSSCLRLHNTFSMVLQGLCSMHLHASKLTGDRFTLI